MTKTETNKYPYHAPTAQVVEVEVERGFAATVPGFNDGGIW